MYFIGLDVHKKTALDVVNGDFSAPETTFGADGVVITDLLSYGYVSLPTLCQHGCSLAELEDNLRNAPLITFGAFGSSRPVSAMIVNGATVGMLGNPTWTANNFDISFNEGLDMGTVQVEIRFTPFFNTYA